MADNDQYNDEYQFADLDTITPDAGDEEGTSESNKEVPPPGERPPKEFSEPANIKRNALIVVVLVILIMVIYKLVGSFIAEKKSSPKPEVTQLKPATEPSPPVPVAPAPAQPAPSPVLPTSQENEPKIDIQINQKLSTLEIGQQSMRTDLSSVPSKIEGLNTSLNTLVAKITDLNGVIANLNSKLDEQAREIERLTVRREVKKVHVARHRNSFSVQYYIQAVIPGRAWLIATNGATLTVREGTTIPGYGMVKLIDPNQGRVITSSGRIIRFSQEDS